MIFGTVSHLDEILAIQPKDASALAFFRGKNGDESHQQMLTFSRVARLPLDYRPLAAHESPLIRRDILFTQRRATPQNVVIVLSEPVGFVAYILQ